MFVLKAHASKSKKCAFKALTTVFLEGSLLPGLVAKRLVKSMASIRAATRTPTSWLETSNTRRIEGDLCSGLDHCGPLSSELETNKPVKAIFWLCLEPFSVQKYLKPLK